jgi:hypothetical protein
MASRPIIFLGISRLSDDEIDDFLAQLARCSDLAGLQHVRMVPLEAFTREPSKRIETLKFIDVPLASCAIQRPPLRSIALPY